MGKAVLGERGRESYPSILRAHKWRHSRDPSQFAHARMRLRSCTYCVMTLNLQRCVTCSVVLTNERDGVLAEDLSRLWHWSIVALPEPCEPLWTRPFFRDASRLEGRRPLLRRASVGHECAGLGRSCVALVHNPSSLEVLRAVNKLSFY